MSHSEGGFDTAGGVTQVGSLGFMTPTTWDAFFRFDNVLIPPGSTILAAWLVYVQVFGTNPATFLSAIALADEDDAVAPVDRVDHMDRLRTAAIVTYNDLTGRDTTGVAYETPDFAAAVQEVIDRPGWVSGNALLVLWDNWVDIADTSATEQASYTHVSYAPPLLHIEYDPPPGLPVESEIRSSAIRKPPR